MTSPVTVPRPAASLDLALIGNCAISALVDNRASLVWACLPRFDSPPVFDALLTAHGERGLVELTGFVGRYAALAGFLNAFEVPAAYV